MHVSVFLGYSSHDCLCRLWQQQGKREHARQRLSDIYGWFTEGFETPDLMEATALLQGLS